MDEEIEMWGGGEPMNDIDWDHVVWAESVKPSIDIKELLNKYHLTINGMDVSVDINKLILLGIIKPE